jgi:tellurite resistance protein TerC
MLEVAAGGWAATLAVITGLLILDWLVLGRRPLTVGVAGAARWSVFYVAVSVAFGVVFGLLNGSDLATQYVTGYLVELSLSVDNLFVLVIIIGGFAVPVARQPKTLTVGIVLALGLRAVVIAVGEALLQAFSFMFLVFGVALAHGGSAVSAPQPGSAHRGQADRGLGPSSAAMSSG